MSATGVFAFVTAYSIQVLIVLGLGLPMPWLLGLKQPSMRLRYYRFLLGAILLLPLLGTLPIRPGNPVPLAVTQFQLVVTDSASGAEPSLLFSVLLFLLAGVAAFGLAGFVLGLARLRTVTRSAVPLPLNAGIARLFDELGFRGEILTVDEFPVPASWGWNRAYILVPPRFCELEGSAQEAVICHELLHLKRGDWPRVLLERLVKLVFWFHPAVHFLIDRIDLTREQLIDREVIRITGRPRIYLETLKRTVETFRQASLAPTIPLIRVSHLKARVASLKEEACMSKSRAILSGSVLVFSLVGLSAVAIAMVPLNGPVVAGQPAEEVLAAGPQGPQSNQEQTEKGEKKEGAINVSDDVDVKIKLVKRVNPVYPEEAKKQGITGTVICRIKIAETGRVESVEVKESPDDLLSKAAVEAVRQWEYEPPTLDGKPVSAIADVTIRFQLK